MSRSDKRRLAIQRGEQMPTFSEQGTDRTDEERSKYIFDKLKREGDCWHEFKDRIPHARQPPYFWCLHCKDFDDSKHQNPSFFNPPEGKEWEYFGFLWERMKECKDFAKFLEKYADYEWDGLAVISCTALAEALETWFKEGEKNEYS